MSYNYVDLLSRLQRLLLRAPGPNQNLRGTYIRDTPPSQKWTKIQRKFRPNHLSRWQQWLPRHNTHAYRVSMHRAVQSIHTTTKSGRPRPKSSRHGRPDLKCGRYISYNKKTLPWGPTALTNHNPENHQRCRHQITCCPLQSCHWKNHATCPNHPQFS